MRQHVEQDQNSGNEGPPATYPENYDEPAGSDSGPLGAITSGLKVMAQVGITLGKSLDDQTRSINTFLRRLQRDTPVDYGNQTSGVFPASGNLLLSLGTPDQGTRWEVASVAVGGVEENTTAAGSAGLYVSGWNGGSPGFAQLSDRAGALPNTAFYGNRQLVVNDQEYLLVVIFGGTPGQTYIANMSATVFNVAAAGGKDVITL